MNRPARVSTALVVTTAVAMCLAGSSPAQVLLEGRVLDDRSEQPVPGARVFLLNHYRKLADYAETDAEGRFSFERREFGRYRLEVRAVGYLAASTPLLWWTMDHDFTGVEIRLAPGMVLLAPIEIVALSPSRTSPILENMEHRRTRGFGIQITRQDIEDRQPLQVTDILAELPGVYAERGGGSRLLGRTISMGRALLGVGGGACPVQIFLDGVLTTRGAAGDEVLIDDLVSPRDVETIEVFRGLGSVPPEFLNSHSRCGVIAIWTKRAPDP